MTHITSNTRSGAVWAAGLAAGVAGATPAIAQSAPDATELDPITVEGEGGAEGVGSNANRSSTRIGLVPATVKETPQIINVLPREQLREQGVTSLEQALRSVPGITMASGEGMGGQNGDQFRIRGFQSKGDVYVDGLRDFGAYQRDSFNLDSLQVIKGPSGSNFGAGAVGGLINQTTKKAHLGDGGEVEGQLGSGPLVRGVVDVNKQINETTAVRLNGVVHDQDVADRDHIFSKRQGFAGALGFGLGTDTTWSLDYMYQRNDRRPDFGVPFVFGPDGKGVPVTERGVGRSTSYARSTDKDVTNAHVVTSQVSKDVNDWLTVTNDTRFGAYDRDLSATTPLCVNDLDRDPTNGVQYAGSCSDLFMQGQNPALIYTAGGGITYKQRTFGLQNVTAGKVEFETFGLRHKGQAGLDLSYQNDKRMPYTFANRLIQNIRDPRFGSGGDLSRIDGDTRKITATNVGLFAQDRMWLTEMFSVQGTLRFDHFRTTFDSPRFRPAPDAPFQPVSTSGETNKVSPSLSAFFEPTPDQTYYLSYSRSYVPVGFFASTLQTNNTAETSGDVPPEKTDLYELGGKVDVLDGRLGLQASAFQIDKSDTFGTSEDGLGASTTIAGFSDAGQKRRVRGVELAATGRVTDAWAVRAGYAFLKSEITGVAPGLDRSVIGNDVAFVSDHNFTLWTTYEISRHLQDVLPGKLTAGAGVTAVSAYWGDPANTARVPATFAIDAMLQYEKNGVRVAVNGYNLTDRLNYTAAFANARATPSSGRTVLLSVGYSW